MSTGPVTTTETAFLPKREESPSTPDWFRDMYAEPFEAAIVSEIRGASFHIDVSDLLDAEAALDELARFDAELPALRFDTAGVLRFIEAQASSAMERIHATASDVAIREAGRADRPDAELVLANEAIIGRMSPELPLQGLGAFARDVQHRLLHATKPHLAGRYRTNQAWIGGMLPPSASFVPPQASRVAAAMADWEAFIAESDVPPVVLAAIAHAHFETVHPFGDGNGRTGRAIAQAMLTRHTVHGLVPLSVGLVGNGRAYVDALVAYRAGDPGPIIRRFAAAIRFGTTAARRLLAALDRISADWTTALADVRQDSTAHRLLDLLVERPVLSAPHAARTLGVSWQAVANGIRSLEAAGIVEQSVMDRRRHRLWTAPRVVRAYDWLASHAALGDRITTRVVGSDWPDELRA